jgi:hypothetical protein
MTPKRRLAMLVKQLLSKPLGALLQAHTEMLDFIASYPGVFLPSLRGYCSSVDTLGAALSSPDMLLDLYALRCKSAAHADEQRAPARCR